MRKFRLLALMATLVGAAMVMSCNTEPETAGGTTEENGGGNNGGGNGGGGGQADDTLSQSVLVANLPANVKITIHSTTTGIASATEDCIYIKCGSEWVAVNLAGSEDEWLMYCKFDKNGNIQKQLKSTDGGSNWTPDDRYSDFPDFARRTTGKSLFYLSLPNLSGTTLLGSMERTETTEAICGHTCVKYNNPSPAQSGENAYWVDNESKLVFKEITQINSTSTYSYVVTGWDASIHSLGYNIPR